MKNMEAFISDIKDEQKKLKEVALKIVEQSLNLGADECEVSIGGAKGLSVSSRDSEVENIEFNRDNGVEVIVYKDHKKGNASTTDLREEALTACVRSALDIASCASCDPFCGLGDKDNMCRNVFDLDLLFEPPADADLVVKLVTDLEKKALDRMPKGIKSSDGSNFDGAVYTSVLANSNDFCQAKSSSMYSLSLTMLGEDPSGKMQRGSGYLVSRDFKDLENHDSIVSEAFDETLGKLGAKKVATGKYNVIFSKGAAVSLWGTLAGAISGGTLYRGSSFLCNALGQKILPDFISIHEDPFVKRGLGSCCYDADGLAVSASDIVSGGILQEYLLSVYSARKLGLKSNGHAGGIHNWFARADCAHTLSEEALLKSAGEGLVITSLMGQGVDLVSGNYSRGAGGYYFKNGEKVHAAEEITIAGNLKDMFKNIASISDKTDPRYKIATGSVLIPNLTISGN